MTLQSSCFQRARTEKRPFEDKAEADYLENSNPTLIQADCVVTWSRTSSLENVRKDIPAVPSQPWINTAYFNVACCLHQHSLSVQHAHRHNLISNGPLIHFHLFPGLPVPSSWSDLKMNNLYSNACRHSECTTNVHVTSMGHHWRQPLQAEMY